MAEYLKSNYIIEENIIIQDIPAILFRPREVTELIPTIIFYHGWGSSNENQRIRGFVLASVGYQVVIPNAIHHGKRSPLTDYGKDAAAEYFWDVIFNNLEEFKIIKQELVTKYNADPKRFAVMGNSMGGFTAGGIFTHNNDIKVLIAFNGSCGWANFNRNIEELYNTTSINVVKLEKKIKDIDPSNHLELLKDRPILLLNGDSDTVVPIESQSNFYNKLYLLYDDKEKIKFIKYPKLNHFVTTNMMEESINWLGRYL